MFLFRLSKSGIWRKTLTVVALVLFLVLSKTGVHPVFAACDGGTCRATCAGDEYEYPGPELFCGGATEHCCMAKPIASSCGTCTWFMGCTCPANCNNRSAANGDSCGGEKDTAAAGGGGNAADCQIGGANLNLGSCYLLNENQTVGSVYNSPSVLINLFVRLSFIGGGLVLFAMIFYSGLLFVKDDIKGKDKAKDVMQSAVMGFIVLFCAYWIIQIIKAITGVPISI
jgi:hypothetical protein